MPIPFFMVILKVNMWIKILKTCNAYHYFLLILFTNYLQICPGWSTI